MQKYILIIVFLCSFILADLNTFVVFRFGNLKVCAIDLVYLLTFIATIKALKNNPFHIFIKSSSAYIVFIVWLIFSLTYGFNKYGFRTVGEGRYIYGLFAFFVPFALSPSLEEYKINDLFNLIEKVIYISAIAGLILFIIEYLAGGRVFFTTQNIEELTGFSDFRGVRYLGSEETYNLAVLAILIILKYIITKNIKIIKLLFLSIIILIIIFTRNRAAPVSLFCAFVLVMINQGKIRPLFKVSLFFVLGVFLLRLIVPNYVDQIIMVFSGVFNIREDATGNWRYLVQLSAITQGLETPIIGQGLGGYFEFYIPELNKIIEYPPHNIFIYLFLKSGLIGLLLGIISLLSIFIRLHKLKRIWKQEFKYYHFYLLFQIILISQLFYGMAYGFSLFYALFAGFSIVTSNLLIMKYSNVTYTLRT